ncbi:MAG TPA: hypothetical protein ENI23_10585 [bacterium]|nr:hypothetical protein [bacterium]
MNRPRKVRIGQVWKIGNFTTTIVGIENGVAIMTDNDGFKYHLDCRILLDDYLPARRPPPRWKLLKEV